MARSDKPNKRPTSVLLDSSFLISMLHDHRDLVEEVRQTIHGPMELTVLDMVEYELQRLARAGHGSSAKNAKLSLETIVTRTTIIEAPFGPREVDLCILVFSLATRNRVVVATADKALLEMCKKHEIPWLRPRGHSGIIASWKDA